MRLKALQTTNITIKGRTIEAKAGETYEISKEEKDCIPAGYFAPATQEEKETKKSNHKE
jgi:hypothetical protein